MGRQGVSLAEAITVLWSWCCSLHWNIWKRWWTWNDIQRWQITTLLIVCLLYCSVSWPKQLLTFYGSFLLFYLPKITLQALSSPYNTLFSSFQPNTNKNYKNMWEQKKVCRAHNSWSKSTAIIIENYSLIKSFETIFGCAQKIIKEKAHVYVILSKM